MTSFILLAHIGSSPQTVMDIHRLMSPNISHNDSSVRLHLFHCSFSSQVTAALLTEQQMPLCGMNHPSYTQTCLRRPRRVWTHLTKPKILWKTDSPPAEIHTPQLFPSSSYVVCIFTNATSSISHVLSLPKRDYQRLNIIIMCFCNGHCL